MDSDSEEYCDALEDYKIHSNQHSSDGFHAAAVGDGENVVDENSKSEDIFSDACDSVVDTTNDPVDADAVKRQEEEQLSEDELLARKLGALELKEDGNDLFKDGAYDEAIEKYSEALLKCPFQYSKERSQLFSNRAACHAKLASPEAALVDCDAAIELDPKYIRCLQRRAALREESDRLTEALEDYRQLLNLDPANDKARWACATLPDRIKVQQEEMKEKMLGQLKDLGNMILKPFGLSTDNFQVQKNSESEGYSINFVR